jgi:tripartite ATP-independent transporter DctM subunit
MPIAIAMAVVGFLGVWYVEGFGSSLTVLRTVPWAGVRNYLLSCIPFFIIMGHAFAVSGVIADLFDTINKWVRQLPGGLAISTVIATAGFGAVCGHPMATAATIGALAYPEMRRHNYSKRLATGCIAAGGSIASLIPPSIPMVIIGLLTELSIGKLLLAGLLPGLLEAASYALMAYLLAKFRPGIAPHAEGFPWSERLVSLKNIWAPFTIFLIVIGGIYVGIFSPTEAAAIGAFAAILLLIPKGKFNSRNLFRLLKEASLIVCSLLPILVGVFILNELFVITRLPMLFSETIAAMNLSKHMLLVTVVILYLILGCFLEPIATWLLTIPVLYPVLSGAGIDGIWFAVVAVKAAEMGLITPPVGMNVFVLKGVVKEVPMTEIFMGIVPFLFMDFITVALLIMIPEISLFLPNLLK